MRGFKLKLKRLLESSDQLPATNCAAIFLNGTASVQIQILEFFLPSQPHYCLSSKRFRSGRGHAACDPMTASIFTLRHLRWAPIEDQRPASPDCYWGKLLLEVKHFHYNSLKDLQNYDIYDRIETKWHVGDFLTFLAPFPLMAALPRMQSLHGLGRNCIKVKGFYHSIAHTNQMGCADCLQAHYYIRS